MELPNGSATHADTANNMRLTLRSSTMAKIFVTTPSQLYLLRFHFYLREQAPHNFARPELSSFGNHS
jgi:hypothetical protein